MLVINRRVNLGNRTNEHHYFQVENEQKTVAGALHHVSLFHNFLEFHINPKTF